MIGFCQCNTLFAAGSGNTIGATTVVLTSLTDIYGNVLTMADFGTKGYASAEPDTTNEEAFTFTGITANGNGTYSLTGVKTCLAKSPYTETAGLIRQHAGGTKVVITDNVAFWDSFVNKNNDSTILGKVTLTSTQKMIYNATPTITDDKELTTKKYVDDGVLAGAPNMSLTVKGIGEEATAAEINAGTQTGGTSAELVVNPKYLKDSEYYTFRPTTDQKDALAGTGTPNSTNKYVTNDDTSATGSANKVYRQTAAGKIDATMLVGNLPAVDGSALTNLPNKYQEVTFQTAGSFQWLCPRGVTSILVDIVAGGGSGSATNQTNNPGAGGGGGAGALNVASTVVPLTFYTVTVGAGGTAVTAIGNAGSAGSASSFNGISKAGGGGGANVIDGTTPTIGGTAGDASAGRGGYGGGGGASCTNGENGQTGTGGGTGGTGGTKSGNQGGAGGGGASGWGVKGSDGASSLTQTPAGSLGSGSGGNFGGASSSGSGKGGDGCVILKIPIIQIL